MYDKAELQKGIKHEAEHTNDKALATKIAVDHLLEDPHYYTKLEKSGLEECGDMDTVTPSISVISIGSTQTNGQSKLTSSGLGGSGAPKPLKSDQLESPEIKKVGANKIANGKTPAMVSDVKSLSGVADPLNHFLGMVGEGDHQYKDPKYANMAGVDNPYGDYGDFDDEERPRHGSFGGYGSYGGAKKIKPQGTERGGPDDPDIDTPDRTS